MMRKVICALFVAVMMVALPLLCNAAETAGIDVTCAPGDNNLYTLQVDFTNVPQNNPVEYAQILLTCCSDQHKMVTNSFSWQASGADLQVTHRFDTAANSLLLLIEPKQSLCPGIGSGAVYNFRVEGKSSQTGHPEFDLDAVLILKDGTELEISRKVTDDPPPQPSVPSTEPDIPVTNPDPGPADPTTAPTTEPATEPATEPTSPPATAPTTAPTTTPTTAPATVPSATTDATQPFDPDTQTPAPADHTWIVTVSILAVIVLAAASYLFLIKKNNAK